MLECNKNYTTLVLNYVLKNLKGIISALGIERNKTLKKALVNAKG